MTASRAPRQWTAPPACGWTMSSPSTDRTTAIGSTLGASNSPLWRAGLTHLWRTCTRIANWNLTTLFLSHIAVRHLHYALTKTTDGRLTSCSPCRGTPALQGSPAFVRGLVTSTGRGTLFAYKKGKVLSPVALWRRISTCSLNTTALYSSTRTLLSATTRARRSRARGHRYSLWAFEGKVVTGKFRRAPDPSCSCFKVANIHINNGCAKRRSVCIALLLLIHELCLTLGAVVLTGDFNKGAERELPPGVTDEQRRITLLETAYSFANFPWHGNKWPECCGFVLLLEYQNQWLVMWHGSFNVVPASVGRKPTDQTWHDEQTVDATQIRWPQTQKGYVPF